MSGPWEFDEARAACRRASANQEAAERAALDAARTAAEAERAYRVALARAIVTAHAEGAAWTVSQDLARGTDEVARLRAERDIAEGVREALQQAVWRAAADRKDAARLSEWSMRRELAENGGGSPQWTGVAS